MIERALHLRLVAEASAFPYAHTRAFETSAHTLGADLQEACVEFLTHRAAGASLSELATLRDRAWFGDRPPRKLPLTEHLLSLATTHLEHRGARIGLRQDVNAELPELMQCWRWLSLRLPADLLVAARGAAERLDAPDEHVELVTSHLARTLSQPCAETHLHIGAAVAFGSLWTALMPALARREARHDLRRNLSKFADALEDADVDLTLRRLRAAAFARLLISTYMKRPPGTIGGFEGFLTWALRTLSETIRWPWGSGDARRGLYALLAPLLAPSAKPRLEEARAIELLRAVYGPDGVSRRGDTPLDVLVARDPLGSHWQRRGDATLPETRFCAHVLRKLHLDAREDEALARLFWQYQRVRNRVYQLVVQEPGVGGLRWFKRFYDRISAFRELLPRDATGEPLWFHALETDARDLNLGALEARTRPDDSRDALRDTLRGVGRQTLAWQRRKRRREGPEVGFVFHFIKELDWKRADKSRTPHEDPHGHRFGTRHASWIEEQQQRVRAMTAVLRDHPELLLVMRGLDVANLETAQPTWALLSLYDEVRRASKVASQRLARVQPTWRVPPMRATLHGGEDYLRLIEGVRRMHEALEFGLLLHGDRIGHGLAVGTDPESTRRSCVVQPAEDRLDDLLWELDRYNRGELQCASARVERVRHEAQTLGNRIYGDVAVDALINARRWRHHLPWLRRLRLPEGEFAREYLRVTGLHVSQRLHLRYLTDHRVFTLGRVGVEVRTDESEVAMLHAAQRWLRRELGRREITIESNPSSNLLIGEQQAFANHPVMRLQPITPTMVRDDVVQVSINTDDPVTFASNLADEFAYVYAALLGHGVPASDALAWIDRRREDGWRSRFTLEASADPEVLRRVCPPAIGSKLRASTTARA